MKHDSASEYILLMPVAQVGGKVSPVNAEGSSTWFVANARPAEGSTTDRILEEATTYHDTSLCEPGYSLRTAVEDFFIRMRISGLSGVLDAGEIRHFGETPLDFCQALTEHIHDDLPDSDAEDFREDDFDNHPLAELREAMIDFCPEYHGHTCDFLSP